MSRLNRREFVILSAGMGTLAPAGGAPARAAGTTNLAVCMHGITSSEFDFRTALEGWARAGIRAVEPDLAKAREWEQANGPGAARRLLDDLGLMAYSSTNQLYLDENGPHRAQAVEDLKWKVAMAQALGADRLVTPSTASLPHQVGDYALLHENLHQAAEIARPYGVTLMLEFTRASTLVGNVRTALDVVRTIDHPNLKFMLDVYHFWAGSSKFEDLDLILPGEIHHVHFQDTPAAPPLEVAQQKDRAYPGEGVAPLQRILDKLVQKGYDRALSLELFDMTVRRTDPFVVAGKGIATINPYIAAVGSS